MTLSELHSLLNASLAKMHFPLQPPNLYDPLRYFLKLGGKRIRPLLSLIGCQLFGKDANLAMNAAISVELFHNFSLIHDDIMDEAPLRRGEETVHTKWNQNIAILSGDVLFVKAYQSLSTNPSEYLPALLATFNQTAAEVCEGQQLDMDFELRNNVTTDEYIEMIRLKTSVLLGAALKLGAIVADAEPLEAEKLYTFGVHVGIAFQIQDDILDLYADPEKFGKQIGGDVISNKKTILALSARDFAAEKGLSEKLISLSSLINSVQKVENTRAIFDELGVRAHCEKLKAKHHEIAMNALESISVNQDSKLILKELATDLLSREV